MNESILLKKAKKSKAITERIGRKKKTFKFKDTIKNLNFKYFIKYGRMQLNKKYNKKTYQKIHKICCIAYCINSKTKTNSIKMFEICNFIDDK